MKLFLRKGLKAQVTIFLILGIVIFILVSFMIYLVSSAAKKQISKETVQSQQTRMNVQTIIEYTNQCLDKVSREGLDILGKQAGYIFESQGGLEPDLDPYYATIGVFFYEDSDVVLYTIRESSTVYDYPWPTFPYYPTASDSPSYEEPIVLTFGIPLQRELLREDGGGNSIQADLEAYVRNNTIRCTDFAIFESQGYNITNGTGKIHVNVTIGENDVSFRLTYPLEIVYFDEKTIVQDFFIRKEIRLKKVYEKFLEIIEDDTNDISYDIASTSSVGDIEILVTPRQNNDDLIQIIDRKSKILGNDFKLQFGRRNRAIALHYIDDSTPVSISGPIADETELETALSFVLRDSDPDEDVRTFGFTDSSGNPLDYPLTASTIRVNVTDGNFTDYQNIDIIVS